MTIKVKPVPTVPEGQSLGIVGAETGTVHDLILREQLDRMDPWTFQESLYMRDIRLGGLGVTESLELVVLTEEKTESIMRQLEEFDGGRS